MRSVNFQSFQLRQLFRLRVKAPKGVALQNECGGHMHDVVCSKTMPHRVAMDQFVEHRHQRFELNSRGANQNALPQIFQKQRLLRIAASGLAWIPGTPFLVKKTCC